MCLPCSFNSRSLPKKPKSLEKDVMDDYKKKTAYDGIEKEIVFSQSVKAGKRVYYLDVKKDRRGDLYLALTESKKISGGFGEVPQFEKHKIFLYKEDVENFADAFADALAYIKSQYPEGENLRRVYYEDSSAEGATEQAAAAGNAEEKGDFEVEF